MKTYGIMLLLLTSLVTSVNAAYYGGIDFPQGEQSFADEVVFYQPSSSVASPYNDPDKALGIPDYNTSISGHGHVSLGDQGVLVLKFMDNSLTTSSSSSYDLWIFEVGPEVEATSVAVSVDGNNWINVGSTGGGTRGIDIDAYIGLGGIISGGKYSYVKLIDLLPHQSGGDFEGADIDAVGAISSAAPVPIPAAAWLLVSGLAGLMGIRKKIEG